MKFPCQIKLPSIRVFIEINDMNLMFVYKMARIGRDIRKNTYKFFF